MSASIEPRTDRAKFGGVPPIDNKIHFGIQTWPFPFDGGCTDRSDRVRRGRGPALLRVSDILACQVWYDSDLGRNPTDFYLISTSILTHIQLLSKLFRDFPRMYINARFKVLIFRICTDTGPQKVQRNITHVNLTHVNLIDLVKSFPTLRNLFSIQPNTSPLKFARS